MSVDQKDVIDAVGRSRETGDVMLTITDHLDWAQPLEHIFTLQEKINSYLSFIESGQIWETCPDAQGKKVFITVYFQHAPVDEDVQRFLAAAKQKIESAGFFFQYVAPKEEPNQASEPTSGLTPGRGSL